jgi:hypothetical protein
METLPLEEWREIAKALVILAVVNFLARCREPEEAKALAYLQDLSLCKDNGIYQTVVECGCSVVVETTSDISQFCSTYRKITDCLMSFLFCFAEH